MGAFLFNLIELFEWFEDIVVFGDEVRVVLIIMSDA